MSIATPRLNVISGFAAATVGERLHLINAKTTEQVDGEDSARFRIRLPTRSDVTLRTPLRFVGSDGITREYRVRRFLRDPSSQYADIEGAPPFVDLTTAGLIRQTVNGRLYTSFGGTLTVSQWITNYVLTNLSADGLTWLSAVLGTIDSTQLVTLTFSQWTRAELLRALADATGLELLLAQSSPGALYQIHLVTEIASAVAPIRVTQSGSLIALSVDSTDEGLTTVVQPLGAVPDGGTEPASIASHIFRVQSIAAGWVVLIDPSSSVKPIAFDDMANGLYLEFITGTTIVRRAITDSRASDGAVYLANTSGLTLGVNVTLVQDANGTPLTTISNPAAIARFGRVVTPISVTGMRGEANRIANANFGAGSSQWSAYAAGWLEPYLPSETADLVGALVGSKTAGSPASLNVDGLAAGAAIRKGERVEVASVLLATNSAEKVISSTGDITLALSGTLAQNVANAALFRVYDTNGMAIGGNISANGSATAGASTLAISAPSMANRAVTSGDQLRFTRGGTYNGLVGTTASYTNATSGEVEWTTTLTLSQYLTNGSAVPDSPTLSAGDALTFTNALTGQYVYGTVGTGGYTAESYSLPISIFVPANTTIDLVGSETIIYATKQTTTTKTITNSPSDWPDSKQITFTWSGGLVGDGATSIELLNNAGVTVATLTPISGVTNGSTSAVLQNDGLQSIPNGAVLYSQPETLYCSALSIANGSGAVTIALQSANTSALADNAVVRVVRNTAGWIDQGSGSQTLLRTNTGWISSEAVIGVATGSSKTLWAHFAAQFWHSRNDYTIGTAVTMRMDVVNAATGAVLVSVTSDPLVFTSLVGSDRPQPIAAVIKAQFEITANTRVRLHVYPQNSVGVVDFATKGYAMASYGMLTEGTDPNVPFTPSSHANLGIQAGIRYLQVYAKEVRSIACTMAHLADITGGQITTQRVVRGVRLVLADIQENLRAMSYERDHLNPNRSTIVLESLRRTATRLLGTGSVTSGSGSVTSVGGNAGGSGGTAPVNGITIVDDSGQQIPGVQVLTVSGLGVALAANGAGGARLSIPTTIDPTGVDAVISGGAWNARDLVTQPGFDISVAAGNGVISGKLVSWSGTTVNTPNSNALVYVDASGIVRTRAATAPETLNSEAELLLYRTYVDVATYGNRIYAVAESRTFYRVVNRAPLFTRQRAVAAQITSGAWAGAVAVNDTGDINWYFANLGLYPLVEEIPSIVEDHLDVQIAKFYGSGGTGSSDWNALHGTTWASNYLRYPYDVGDPRGTPVKRRADSHDAYAGTFLRLAVRYARIASGGLTWWDTNYNDIKECFYRNIVQSQRAVNGGAGYMCETFQDPTVYPFCQTLDNIEAWRGLQDAFELMTSRGGTQASDAAYYQSVADNMLSGIRSQWRDTANANGETGWLAVAWDNGAGDILTNELTRFYPDLTIGVPAAIYDCPLHGTDSIARERLDKLFRHLNQKAPTWFMSRRYDLYPWGMLAAAAVKVGYRDLAERWLAFVQIHHAYDSPGYLLIHDLGWARYIERVLQGDSLT